MTLILFLLNLNDKSDKNAVIVKRGLRQFERFLGTAASPSPEGIVHQRAPLIQ
jgi:hypothetical protein